MLNKINDLLWEKQNVAKVTSSQRSMRASASLSNRAAVQPGIWRRCVWSFLLTLRTSSMSSPRPLSSAFVSWTLKPKHAHYSITSYSNLKKQDVLICNMQHAATWHHLNSLKTLNLITSIKLIIMYFFIHQVKLFSKPLCVVFADFPSPCRRHVHWWCSQLSAVSHSAQHECSETSSTALLGPNTAPAYV